MKNIIIAIVALAVIGAGVYYFTKSSQVVVIDKQDTVATTTPPTKADTEGARVVIGQSVEGRDIVAYNYGTGDKRLLLVGGIHGGYEWNTALVAFKLNDYFKNNPNAVPANVKVTIIPVLNPDGLAKVVGTSSAFTASNVSSSQTVQVAGRFNGNEVDLNRNFDCDWQANATWQNKAVSGGDKAFSEPESLALKNFVDSIKPTAVIVWYSAAGGVFSSSCHNGVLPETKALTNTFAKASGYPAYEEFNFYEITGDMVNWLAREQIPAISVLLTNHTDIEWSKNLAGIQAVLNYYTK
jgi:hypothetical protein